MPSIEVLRRLVEATGSSLVIQLAPRTSQEASSPAGSVLEMIRTRRDELIRAAGEFGASNLRVFGSVARGEERPGSDVDLLVDLEKPVGLIGLARIEDALGTIVGRRVEIVPTYALDSESGRTVLREAVPL